MIGAGSLLKFTLNDANFRMPVGRIQSLYLKPLSFNEYLTAMGYSDLREFIEQIDLLQQAGLIYNIYSTAASGIPLITLINEKKFKILFLDVVLITYSSRIEVELLLNDMILLNRGALTEQFVGQELLAYQPYYEDAKLYFWCREKKSSMAEVDFIITVGSHIIPIEVKAGATGQLKSLHLLMAEKKLPLGVRVSQHPLTFDGNILSVPMYMVSQISPLVENILKNSY